MVPNHNSHPDTSRYEATVCTLSTVATTSSTNMDQHTSTPRVSESSQECYWYPINAGSTKGNLLMKYQLVVDNAKTHQAKLDIVPLSLQTCSKHHRTRRGGRRHSQRRLSRNLSTTTNATTPLSSKKNTTTTDDIALTKSISSTGWKIGPVRRAVSSDCILDDNVLDRWMASQPHKRTGLTPVRLPSLPPRRRHYKDDDDALLVLVSDTQSDKNEKEYQNDDSSDSDDDNGEFPSYACINAHQPIRQPSEDPEELRKLVEHLRGEGIIA